MISKYIESRVGVYVSLEAFNDDEIIDEVKKRISKVKKDISELSELEENLSEFHKWNNQETAKEFFESLSFSSSLKNWILKTYKES